MAQFQKVYLRVTGRVGDTPADSDKLPDRVMATGQIFLKPNIKEGWAEQTTGEDGIDELMVPAPINCTIEDGMMTYNGDPYVWLVVGEENWNWNISFPQVRIAGVLRKIDSFNFDLEPATEAQMDDEDYQGVNLALLQEFTDPDTGNKAVRGPRGYSVDGVELVDFDKLVFSLDDPMDTDFPPVTIPAITQANTARDEAEAAQLAAEAAQGLAETARSGSESARDASVTAKNASEAAKLAAETAANNFDLDVGTVTTLPPGSSATVSISGGPPGYVADFGIPQGLQGPEGDVGPPAPDATSSVKGIIQLAGALTGSAAAPDLADGYITTGKIADGQVNSAKIADGSIVNADINASAAIAGSKIADTSITGGKLVNDTITATQIAPNAITSSELADNAVDTAAIGDGQVTSAKIADGTIVDADIAAAAAIALTKLATGRVNGSKNGVATNITIWVGTEAQYNTATSSGASEDPNTLYFRSA